MGTIAGLDIPSKEIRYSDDEDGFFVVRGLSFTDVTAVFKAHTGEFTEAFEKLVEEGKRKGGGANLTNDDVKGMVLGLVDTAPNLCCALIAQAAGEPEHTENLYKLRAGVQAEAMEQVVLLTFPTEAEVKKLVEIVLRAIEGLSRQVESLGNTPFTIGSGGSEDK